jgi:PhnB protein
MTDRAVPNLPSRDLDVTAEFYGALGLAPLYRDAQWLILSREGLELEFFLSPDLEPEASSFRCSIRVDDVDALYGRILDAGVHEQMVGRPRLMPVRMQPWGQRVGFLVDPDGTQLQLIENTSPPIASSPHVRPSGSVPYLFFPGSAREALGFYRSVFGGRVELHTRAEFGRNDGSTEAIAHGWLRGPVPLFAADEDAAPLIKPTGLVLSLLGAADPAVTERWFALLSAGARDVDPLQRRSWGDHDGQVTDRFGIRWLLGYTG